MNFEYIITYFLVEKIKGGHNSRQYGRWFQKFAQCEQAFIQSCWPQDLTQKLHIWYTYAPISLRYACTSNI